MNLVAAAQPGGSFWPPWPRVRRLVLLGLLWAVGVATFELTGLPWARLDATSLLLFGLEIVVGWFLVGLFVVGYTDATVGRWPASAVLLGYLAVAPAGAFIYYVFSRTVLGNRIAQLELRAPYGHLFWMLLFYGALFVAWSLAAERADATRRLLAEAEIARRRGEAELGRARLLALRGQVDPALVLDVMAAVQRRYRDDPAAGDRLLDQLVAFLRCAMPAVRSGASTLEAEVALVRAWAALQRERDPGAAVWQIDVPEPLPPLAFPPLLLLPLLEQLGAGGGRPPCLRVVFDAAAARLDIDAPPGAAAPDAALVYRLRVGLQAVCGETWTLVLHGARPAAGPGLSLSVRLPPPEPPDPARGALR